MEQNKQNEGLIKSIAEELTEADYKRFARLMENEDFQRWREVVERYLQSEAYQVLTYKHENEQELMSRVHDSRGGLKMWNRITRFIDSAEEILGTNKDYDEQPGEQSQDN